VNGQETALLGLAALAGAAVVGLSLAAIFAWWTRGSLWEVRA